MVKKKVEYEEDEEEEFEEDEEEIPKKIKKKLGENKEIEEGNWETVSQNAFVGYRNKKTNEVITPDEAIRKILDWSEEAAKNTR